MAKETLGIHLRKFFEKERKRGKKVVKIKGFDVK